MHIDGNGAAGVFAEALGIDITVAVLTCAGCGAGSHFADSHVYDQGGPGIVARCASCDHIVARLVRTPTDAWLDLRGTSSLRIPLPPES